VNAPRVESQYKLNLRIVKPTKTGVVGQCEMDIRKISGMTYHVIIGYSPSQNYNYPGPFALQFAHLPSSGSGPSGDGGI